MNPIKILVLTANPQIPEHEPLRVGAEVRRIEEALQRSRYRDCFSVATKLALRTVDLQRALLDYRPQIVHFSGHGTGDQGLVLENDAGKMQVVSTEALTQLFGTFETGEIECVVLNACYSEVQAAAIHLSVDCVVGMNQPINDQAAVLFAERFYDALGAGSDYDEAFKMGCSGIGLDGLKSQGVPQHLVPVQKYRKRRGVGSPAERGAAQTEGVKGNVANETTPPPPQPAQSQSVGNVTISGSNNPFNAVQANGNATVSQNNSRQSLNISGGTISGQVGLAGGDLTQTQYQTQGEGNKPLSAAEVVQLIVQIEGLLRSTALPEGQQSKAVAYLEMAKEEAGSEEPDKEFAAKNLQKLTNILKGTNEAADAGQSLWNKVAPLLGRLLPWLGVAASFLSL